MDLYENVANSVLRNINNYSATTPFVEIDSTFVKCYQNDNYRLYRDNCDSTIIVYFVGVDVEIDEIFTECVDISVKNDLCVICFPLESLGKANILIDQMEHQNLNDLPICIVAYDSLGNESILKKFRIVPDQLERRSSSELKSFWCWWRDASHYEIAQILSLSFKYSHKGEKDIYTKYIYPDFYNLLITGQTKNWEGKTRNKKESESSFKAEKQNYKIPLVQLGLIDTEGYISNKGKYLLSIYNNYPEEIYFKTLSKMILIDGKHLFLIKDLVRFQTINRSIIPSTSEEFFILFEKFMAEKNILGTRKPSAVTTGAKKSYIRDEPKLWNKLGLFKLETSSRYYIPYKGIDFDYSKILNTLIIHI